MNFECQCSTLKNYGECSIPLNAQVCHKTVCQLKRFTMNDCAVKSPEFFLQIPAKCIAYKYCSCNETKTVTDFDTKFSLPYEMTSIAPIAPIVPNSTNTAVKCDLTDIPICTSCSLEKSVLVGVACALICFIISTVAPVFDKKIDPTN